MLPESNYLVTQAISTSTLPDIKVNSDLAQLEKAERKINYKANIAKGSKSPQVYVAMTALRLANPFKGY